MIIEYNISLILQLIVVALLWGGTNPLIKKGTKHIRRVEDKNPLNRFVNEIFYLVLNWRYVLPFLLNQCGSVIFFFTLQQGDLNVIIPLTNSLSYIFTVLVGYMLGESRLDKQSILGLLLIMAGTTCFALQ